MAPPEFPRPRSRRSPISDTAVLSAFERAMLEVGPVRLTLRDIADEAGLAPPTLLQRFGNREGLYLAAARWWATRAVQRFHDDGRAPLTQIEEGYRAEVQFLDSPEAASHYVAHHHLQLAHPRCGPIVRRAGAERRAALRTLLDRAVADKALASDTATGRLAHSLEVAFQGSLGGWALHRSRTLERWVVRELRRTLRGHLR